MREGLGETETIYCNTEKKKRTTEAEGKERKERGGMELRQVMALTPHPHLAPQRAKQIQQAQTKERDEPLWWDCGRPAL